MLKTKQKQKRMSWGNIKAGCLVSLIHRNKNLSEVLMSTRQNSARLLMCLELSCLFSPLSGVCFKSCSVPLLKSDLLLRVAESMFISSVNRSTFWRPHQQALLLRDCEETCPPPKPTPLLTHTPLQIAGVYVPGCPVNFLSSVHRYADISGIRLIDPENYHGCTNVH